MARTIDSGTLAQIEEGRVGKHILMLFQFPSGDYGFFDGKGSLEHNSITYLGAGSLFEVDGIQANGDGTASSITLKLNGNADTLDANALATIEEEDYAGAPVSLMRRYYDPDTFAELSVEVVFQGYVDQISHYERTGGDAYLEVVCESRALDLGRSGYRMRSDADQRSIDADDGFYRHAQAAKDAQVYWGRKPPESAS